MKTVYILLVAFLATGAAHAQRGDIVVPLGAQIIVPTGAQICADRIFASNPGYGTLTIADASCLCRGMMVVPVELLSFSASRENGAVLLQWTTATETNCRGFELQRMIPSAGSGWQPLGFVDGAGTTALRRDYAFTDPCGDVQPGMQLLVYRLRIVDFDGTFDFSAVVEIRFDSEALPYAFSPVYPNPAAGSVQVSFTLPDACGVTFTLYAVTGGEVARLMDERQFDRGSHVVTVPTAGLSPGTYLLELRTRHGRKTQTIVLID